MHEGAAELSLDLRAVAGRLLSDLCRRGVRSVAVHRGTRSY